MTQIFKQWRLACIAFMGLIAVTGCSNDDEPEVVPDEGPQPVEQVRFADDLLNGGLVYVGFYSEGEGFNIPLKVNRPVKFKVCNDLPCTVETVTDEDGSHLVGTYSGAFSEKAQVLVMRAESTTDPTDFRHFLVLVINKDAVGGRVAKSNSSNMTRAYGDFIGMGTQCFEMLGNTKRAILQSSLIPVEDQNLVTSQVLDLTEMFEVAGESFESSMTSWSAQVGLSFKGLSKKDSKWKLSGCVNFGINKTVNTSNDFEYYLNVYKVVRGEIAYNMKEFENMAVNKDSKKADAFLSYVSSGFIHDVLEVENDRLDTEGFFNVWGTDMIGQAQLGGFKIYMYGRETNTYENSIGIDASVEMKGSQPQEMVGRQWLDIYRAKNSPYIGGSVGGSYMGDEYFKASKMMKYSLAVGGNPSVGEDPDTWIAGFETMDDNVKWQPISYRRNSDSSIPGSDEVWGLYPVEDMATNVVNAVENLLNDQKLSHQDSVMIDNARSNVEKLSGAKVDYVARHLTYPKEASRLVLCDVMMKYDQNKQRSGKPEPFVAKDPRDDSKYRTYYPMMANKFFDKARGTEHQRGRAIDTNVDCFIVAVETGSHYWYYALAHEDDCTGIVDITFYDHLENNFTYRGDAASVGSGVLNYPKQVCVKYYDSKHPDDQKITAFGIYDDHGEVNNIIASTGGSELALEATESEYNEWAKFWEGAKAHHEWPKYAFYHGGWASIPHGIYVKYTTKTLPISNIKNVKHPEKY